MLRQQLYDLCHAQLARDMAATRKAMDDARDAANEDTKSSAGDKYETTREMMQQDMNVNLLHLAELQKQKAALDLIDPAYLTDKIQPGSVVHTTQGNYYLAISLGKLSVDGATYYALSPASPLGIKLLGLQQGDKFSFNGKEFLIKEIH